MAGARRPRTNRGSTSAVQQRASFSCRGQSAGGGRPRGALWGRDPPAGCSPLRAWQRQTMSRCSAPRSKIEMIAARFEVTGQTLRGMGKLKRRRRSHELGRRAVRPDYPEPVALPASSKQGAFPFAAASDGSATRPMLERPAPIKPQSAGGSPAHPREQRWPKPHSASTICRRSPSELLQSPASASATRQQAADGDPGSPSVNAGESIRCLSEAAIDCINSNFPASHLDGDQAEALSASARSVRSQLNSGSSRPKCP